MKKTGRTHIKLKVIVGYILAFATIVISGFIAHQSYNKLLESVYSLSNPDAEIIRMNRILTNLSEAENHIRIYSLTREQDHLDDYVNRVEQIQMELDSLKVETLSFGLPVDLIDSMRYLLQERSQRLDSFVKLKREKERISFSQKAMQELGKAADTTSTKVKTTTTTYTSVDTVDKPVVVREKKKGLFRRWFSREKTVEKVDTQTMLVQRTHIVVDTTYIPQSDSILVNIKNILQDAREQELKMRAVLSRKELKLISENSFILSKVKKILRQLEVERLRQLVLKTDNARKIANESIFMISIIIIVGIVLGVLFIIFILNDVSKSTYYRKQLIIAKGKAEKLAKVKEDFLATMSHEIRTPLNAVIGFSHQMGKTQLDKKQKTFLTAINNSSKHLLGLVNEILDLSKIEAGKFKTESMPFDPHSLVLEVYEVLSLAAKEKGLECSWSFLGEQNLILQGDPFRLKQILFNLGSNAIKFTDSGSVEFKASVEKDKNKCVFRVVVEDTGIGIARDKQISIFEDFNQADSFSARQYGGTGLGLSISRRLARLMGGELYVKSDLGKGSEFTMEIPLKCSREHLLDVEMIDEITIPEGLVGKRFLVADDDTYSLLLLKTILGGWGLKADFVSDGKKAWKLLEQRHYDLILTDIHMPGMGGLELCRSLRKMKDKIKASLPVVALTANVRESELDKYREVGMNHCLVKPLKEKILLDVLCELLNVEGKPSLIKEAEGNTSELLFDLREIKKFTDDPQLIRQVMVTFVDNAQENLELMHQALLHKRVKQIGEIAHKMLTSYTQFGVKSVVPILKELEDLLHGQDNDNIDMQRIEFLVSQAAILSQRVLKLVKENINPPLNDITS